VCVWLGVGASGRAFTFGGPKLSIGTSTQGYLSTGGATGSGVPEISAGDLSPYHGTVSFSRGNDGATKSGSEEYLRLIVSGYGASVPITGWTITDDASKVSVTIPAGVETLRSGAVNQAGTIVVNSGDEVYVSTGRSPVGASFRENECTGYLADRQSFTPPLSAYCPAAADEYRAREDATPDDACLRYLGSIPPCGDTSAYPSQRPSSSCVAFAETELTYNSCVAEHQSDSTFKNGTWRVYLGISQNLWNDRRDTIRLLDANGKTVDVLSY
jgi:hypothetical protein